MRPDRSRQPARHGSSLRLLGVRFRPVRLGGQPWRWGGRAARTGVRPRAARPARPARRRYASISTRAVARSASIRSIRWSIPGRSAGATCSRSARQRLDQDVAVADRAKGAGDLFGGLVERTIPAGREAFDRHVHRRPQSPRGDADIVDPLDVLPGQRDRHRLPHLAPAERDQSPHGGAVALQRIEGRFAPFAFHLGAGGLARSPSCAATGAGGVDIIPPIRRSGSAPATGHATPIVALSRSRLSSAFSSANAASSSPVRMPLRATSIRFGRERSASAATIATPAGNTRARASATPSSVASAAAGACRRPPAPPRSSPGSIAPRRPPAAPGTRRCRRPPSTGVPPSAANRRPDPRRQAVRAAARQAASSAAVGGSVATKRSVNRPEPTGNERAPRTCAGGGDDQFGAGAADVGDDDFAGDVGGRPPGRERSARLLRRRRSPAPRSPSRGAPAR